MTGRRPKDSCRSKKKKKKKTARGSASQGQNQGDPLILKRPPPRGTPAFGPFKEGYWPLGLNLGLTGSGGNFFPPPHSPTTNNPEHLNGKTRGGQRGGPIPFFWVWPPGPPFPPGKTGRGPLFLRNSPTPGGEGGGLGFGGPFFPFSPPSWIPLGPSGRFRGGRGGGGFHPSSLQGGGG
eukprot:FR735769.1.p1 GENE.FR735769.1~~FR735769.1.p1  ORF type:complete len:179 (+),score=88.98 FR735769.1:644-1180(+)